MATLVAITRGNNDPIPQRITHHFQCHYKSFNVEVERGDSPSSVIDTDPEGRTECNPESEGSVVLNETIKPSIKKPSFLKDI